MAIFSGLGGIPSAVMLYPIVGLLFAPKSRPLASLSFQKPFFVHPDPKVGGGGGGGQTNPTVHPVAWGGVGVKTVYKPHG